MLRSAQQIMQQMQVLKCNYYKRRKFYGNKPYMLRMDLTN